MFILIGIISGIFIAILVVYMQYKEQQIDTANKNKITEAPTAATSESKTVEEIVEAIGDLEEEYETTSFHIAGTTFKDGRFSRQTALRMLYFKDAPMDGSILFEFEQYEYEGKPAVKIIANDRILGNVPADTVDEFIDRMNNHEDYDIDYMVIGGNGLSYGCIMTFTWK